VNSDVTAGSDAPAGTEVTTVGSQVAKGNNGIALFFNGTALQPGTKQIVTLRFHILPGASKGASTVKFTNTPTSGETVDELGRPVTVDKYESDSRIVPPAGTARLGAAVITS